MPIESLDDAVKAYLGTWSPPTQWHKLIFRARKSAFLAGAEWMRKQFTLHGTDACKSCDTGRATLYATLDGQCIECAHKREEAAK